jgi:type III restriction enzyme
MARRQMDLPDDWVPTQAVDDPILNSPYEEPTRHWIYTDGKPELMDGRRSASYYYSTRRTGAASGPTLFQEESRDDLPLINALRDDVRRWRESGYRGATAVTQELLRHWRSKSLPRRLFFCQVEAVESILFLLEIALPGRLSSLRFTPKVKADDYAKMLKGEMPGFETFASKDFFPRLVDIPIEPEFLPLTRLGCKMATGSGKTLVMAMIIVWAFANRGVYPQSREFPLAVFVCAPNLTVKKRLLVLKPDDPENYYDAFDLVPTKYRELLNRGFVEVENWHRLAPANEHSEGGTTYRVVEKGEESPEAFAINRLGHLASYAPILVLNDEGHHCWRPKPNVTERDVNAVLAELDLDKEEKDQRKEEVEEARVWLAGLDRINNAGLAGKDPKGQLIPTIRACIDLSATPFYLGNSGYHEGSPFPWLVSDFGLVDAIESGITKIPRLPVKDDTGQTDDAGRPVAEYFRLWETIKDRCATNEKVGGKPTADASYKHAEDAIKTLASQWKLQFDAMASKEMGSIPPVLIIVCDNTEISQVFFEKISGEWIEEIPDPDNPAKTIKVTRYGRAELFPELANSEEMQRTIRIDSKLLSKIESEEGESRDQAVLRLRDLIYTVGKKGQPGEHVRCVVSVSMLTEGWDACNVTHILGVRAFGSQLLCEQVVGRGLRRMSYDVDENERLPAEYVDVYGIPFSLIPYKGKQKDSKKTDPVYHRIYAVPERSDYEVQFPIVEGYRYIVEPREIKCDVTSLEETILEPIPNKVWVRPTKGINESSQIANSDAEQWEEHNRDEYLKTVRLQQLIFRLSEMVLDDIIDGATMDEAKKAAFRLGARHTLFPSIVGITQCYVETKVVIRPDADKRDIGMRFYAEKIVQRVRDGILPDTAKSGTLVPRTNRFKPERSSADVDYSTTQGVKRLAKSHLNQAVIQSGDEEAAIEVLEELDCVDYFCHNDRKIGLQVHFDFGAAVHSYEPDFIIRLANGKTLLLETKGWAGAREPDKIAAKNAAAKKWCSAVSNIGRYGEWEFLIFHDVNDNREMFAKCIRDMAGLANDGVEIVTVAPGARPPDCIPLLPVSKLISGTNAQASLDPTWFLEHLRVPGKTFVDGQFAMRIPGTYPREYGIFGAPDQATPAVGKTYLCVHPANFDPGFGAGCSISRLVKSSEVETDSGPVIECVLQNALDEDSEIRVRHISDGKLRFLARLVDTYVPASSQVQGKAASSSG